MVQRGGEELRGGVGRHRPPVVVGVGDVAGGEELVEGDAVGLHPGRGDEHAVGEAEDLGLVAREDRVAGREALRGGDDAVPLARDRDDRPAVVVVAAWWVEGFVGV